MVELLESDPVQVSNHTITAEGAKKQRKGCCHLGLHVVPGGSARVKGTQ